MNEEKTTGRKDEILELADAYAHEVYRLSRKLPKDELFGITSQLRRSALSVPLNIIEGHARGTHKNRLNFCRIAFGSLKESQYILTFVREENLLNKDDIRSIHQSGDLLSAMLWKKIRTMEANS